MARPGLERNAKFKRLVRVLGVPKPYCRGLLETLWDVAYECGNPVIGDAEAIEAAAEWPGEPGALFEALLNAGGPNRSGFIEDAGNGQYQVHDLFDHAPDYVKKRQKRESQRRTTADNSGQRPVTDREKDENGRTPAPAPAPAPAPPPPIPLPVSGAVPEDETLPADWLVVVEVCRSEGMGVPEIACRSAIASGCLASEAMAATSHWQAHKPAWGIGLLYKVIEKMQPEQKINWPAAGDEFVRQKAREEVSLRQKKTAAAAKVAKSTREAHSLEDAKREAAFGRKLDAMSSEKIAVMIGTAKLSALPWSGEIPVPAGWLRGQLLLELETVAKRPSLLSKVHSC